MARTIATENNYYSDTPCRIHPISELPKTPSSVSSCPSGRELSEFLSAFYLSAQANSLSFSQNSPSLRQNSISAICEIRNSTLETVFRPFPRSVLYLVHGNLHLIVKREFKESSLAMHCLGSEKGLLEKGSLEKASFLENLENRLFIL